MEFPPIGGDVDKSGLVLSISWAFTSVSSIFVALRLYSRVRHTNNLWWDDFFIVLGECLTIGESIIFTIYAGVGGCRHFFYLSDAQGLQALKLNFMFQPFVIMAAACCKVSVAFLILRLQTPGKIRMNLLIFFASTYWLWSILCTILLFAQCKPAKSLWTPTIEGECWPRKAYPNFALALASYNAFLDLAFVAIPISIVWQLQLNSRKKIELSLLLGIGVLASVCSIIKTTKLPALAAESDVTWNTLPIVIWVPIEDNVIIIAACVPALRPLYLVLFGRPGAERYTKKKGYHIHSSSTKNTLELQPVPLSSAHQHSPMDSHNGHLMDKMHSHGIMRTTDLDVRFENPSPQLTPVISGENGRSEWKEERKEIV